MLDADISAEPYRFGRFTLDPTARRLSADGAVVPLGSTAFNVLLALVERTGSVVTKSDLISQIWGHSDVGDNRLQVHINALRKVVGKDCIVTKHRDGYRFVAEVQRTHPRAPGSSDIRGGNLPSLWTASEGPSRLIGRSDELRAIERLLQQVRLVTLTGPGGVGKTRLGVQAANENSAHFPDGAWLVELATLKDPDLVPGTIAADLGINVGQTAAPLDALMRHLARKTLLIVLDNCEHLIVAAAHACEALLRAAPGVKILATSREALSCSGEQTFEVPPLEVPDEGVTPSGAIREMAAVELFAEQAKGARANFWMDDEEVKIAGRICRRLDGLPLAIEMVAGWAGVFGLKALDAEFDGPATAWVRAGNMAPPRHVTLRATLVWSYDLLSAAEQAVLRRLAVFAGGFTVLAAKIVASDETIPPEKVFEHLGSLIRKSMVAAVPGAQRYRLLETTRAFLLEKLAASDEARTLGPRHARYVLQSLEGAEDELETAGDRVWLGRYRPLLDDLRNALDWAMDQPTDDAVAIAGASWPLWREASLRAEGRQRLSAAAHRLHPGTPPALEARLRRGLGSARLNSADVNLAHADLMRAAALYRSLGERLSLGSALSDLAFALLMLGRFEDAERTIAEARKLLEHAGRPRTLAMTYSNQLCIESSLGRFASARALAEKTIRLCDAAGADRLAFVVASNLVEATLESGDLGGTILAGRELVARLRGTTYSDHLAVVLGTITAALVARGDLVESLSAAAEACPLLRDHGMLFWLLDHLALRAALAGRLTDAAQIAGYADSIYMTSSRTRDAIGARATERLVVLLGAALSDEEIEQQKRDGMQLTEEQAVTLALRA